MANFTKSFTDFSYGEIEESNIEIAASYQKDKAASLMDNVTLSDTKGFERRTGTIRVATPKYMVDPDNLNVTTHDFFVGKGLSFVCLMYVVDTSLLDPGDLSNLDATTRGITIPTDSKVLCMDWYQSDGFVDTYLNTVTLCIDADNRVGAYDYPSSIRVRDNKWFDLYGFSKTSFQNLLIFTHSSGSVMPFVLYYTVDPFTTDASISWFAHNDGLTYTNKEYWTDTDVGNAFSRPFNKPNLNPRVSLGIESATPPYSSGDVWFDITPRYYNNATSAWVDWLSPPYAREQNENPLGKRCDYLQIKILNNTYILNYEGTYTGGGSLTGPVDDMSAYAKHLYRVVIDSESPDDLYTVVASGKNILDFSVESFSTTYGFPENAIFYDQRLVFVRDGRYFNSAVGNAFFFNQYRLPQTKPVGVYVKADDGSGLLSAGKNNLLIDYSGTKIASDPFDMIPLSDVMTDVSWINKGDEIEIGTYSAINTISGLEDSVYAFNSIRSKYRGSYGSKSHISVKAGSDTIFIDASNRKLRNYFYSSQAKSQTSTNLNNLNNHVIGDFNDTGIESREIEIKELTYDQDSEILYTISSPTNQLRACVYDRGTAKLCWHRITLGGVEGGVVTVRSASHVRNDTSDSYTYISVERDGVFYLEKFAKRYDNKNFNTSTVYGSFINVSNLPYYLDFSKGFLGSTDTWNIGMEYANTTVSVLADGFWIDNVECDGTGEIVLDRVVRYIVVGYKYKSRFRTLGVEPVYGGEVGNALHHLKSINYVHLRLVNSYGGKICTGDLLSDLEYISYSMDEMMPDTNLYSFTGSIDIHLSQEARQDNTVYIETEAPYPLRIEAIVIKGESNER